MIQADSLPADVRHPEAALRENGAGEGPVQLPAAGLDLPRHLETQEREFVTQALRQSGGRHDKAARLLGITPRQLRHLLDKYDLRRSRSAADEADADL